MSRTLSRPSFRPVVPLDDVQHFVLEDASWDLYDKRQAQDENAILRAFVAWVRKNGWSG